MKNIIFIAPPAAGKGTQAALLNEKYGLISVSTGDLLRNIVASGNEKGTYIKSIMDSGKLVDDDIIFDLLEDRITKEDCGNGYILDGFPRTVDQAKRYNELAKKLNQEIGSVIYIKVDKELAMQRACGRLTCPDCSAIFHKYFTKPKVENTCDNCGSTLVSRSDDNEETFMKRFDTYMSNVEPLIAYYKELGLLYEVEAHDDKMETFTEIEKVLNN